MDLGEVCILYHFWLSPVSRRVRLHLSERGVDFELRLEYPWRRRPDFLILNASGEVPVLEFGDGFVAVGGYAISEYLEAREGSAESYALFGDTAEAGAEVRRLLSWFDDKFYYEVLRPIVGERVEKMLSGGGSPDSGVLQVGYKNLAEHMCYFEALLERRSLLAGERLSLADLGAAGHLSCLDYLGCIAWDDYPLVREWYRRLKSRPSFRGLLEDSLPELLPSSHYSDLDW